MGLRVAWVHSDSHEKEFPSLCPTTKPTLLSRSFWSWYPIPPLVWWSVRSWRYSVQE